MKSTPPLGHPDNPQTKAAPVDALLIARAFRPDGDDHATTIVLKHSDPYSVALQLAGWLRAAIEVALQHGAGESFGDTCVDDVLDRWLSGEREKDR
jgi:hypothetical protein